MFTYKFLLKTLDFVSRRLRAYAQKKNDEMRIHDELVEDVLAKRESAKVECMKASALAQNLEIIKR